VRLSGVPSARSRALISCTDRPARRNSTARARARSLAGAVLEPGLPGRGEQLQLAGAEVAQQAGHAGAGIEHGRPRLRRWRP
jgi:hypothetical protein